ncbi:MAG: DinB family protein [Candidatus Dormibacteraeota bacterium]|nr:DinB family protein [Candidatus Dormibacteraeota bacterium]
MKIESTSFTRADVEQFLETMLDHDRNLLADRLEKASARLAELGPRIPPGAGENEWSLHEVLAHIAVLSKFYGVLVHKISSGQMTEVDLQENVNLRDVVGAQMAQIEPSELLRMALADQARTLKLLRTVEPSALRRKAKLENGEMMSADEVARLPLVNHLEMHVEQLERGLG